MIVNIVVYKKYVGFVFELFYVIKVYLFFLMD